MAQSKVVKGLYFQTTKKGYKNRGHQYVQLGNNPNFLDIASRCNELLRSERQSEEEDELKQVQCMQVNQTPTPQKSVIAKQLLNSNPNAKFMTLRKSQIRTIKETDENEEDMKRSQTTIKRDKQIDSYIRISGQEKRRMDEKYQRILKQLQNQKEVRLNLQKEYNTLLNQAIKTKYQSEEKRQEEQEQEIPALNLKSKKKKQKNTGKRVKTTNILYEDQDENDKSQQERECLTARVRYGRNQVFQQQEQARGKTTARQTYNQVYEYDNDNMEFRIFQELNNLQIKMCSLEQSIKTKEEKIMRNILERDLKSREREVEFLKNENLKLKEGEMGLKGHSVRYAEGGQSKTTIFNYIVLFLLAFLFARTISC